METQSAQSSSTNTEIEVAMVSALDEKLKLILEIIWEKIQNMPTKQDYANMVTDLAATMREPMQDTMPNPTEILKDAKQDLAAIKQDLAEIKEKLAEIDRVETKSLPFVQADQKARNRAAFQAASRITSGSGSFADKR